MRILKKRAKAVRAFVVFGATVALVGLVVACQGPVGLQGASGDKGDAGPVGEKGAPGDPTLANALPSLIKEFPAVRLEGPDGGTITSIPFDLSTHFKDEETLYLTFSAKTDNAKIATVKLSAAVPAEGPQNNILTITAVDPGKAIVTVTAYDGVNDPLSAVIDVSVVADNSPPTIDAPAITGGLLPLFTAALDPLALGKLYLSGPYSGAESFKFSAQISTGMSGTTEDGDTAKFVVMYGADATSTIATASVSPAPTSASLVEYTVTVTPLKAGVEMITIFVEDGFGEMTEVGEVFTVTVNTPPALVLDSDKVPVTMDDVTLYVSGTGPAGPMVLRPSMVTYAAAAHFVVEADDTVCAYVTNPTVLPTGLATMEVTDTNGVTSAAIAVVAMSLPNGRSFQLTISCSDKEATVSDSATITIHN